MFEDSFGRTPSTLNDAIKMIAAGLDALARVDLDQEDDRALLDATAALQEHRNRFDGQQLRVIEAVDRRGAYGIDAAVTTASWIRNRTRQAPGEVTQQVKAAKRLRDLPSCVTRWNQD